MFQPSRRLSDSQQTKANETVSFTMMDISRAVA